MLGGNLGDVGGLGRIVRALLNPILPLSVAFFLGCAHSESYRLASPARRSPAPSFHQHQTGSPEAPTVAGTGSRRKPPGDNTTREDHAVHTQRSRSPMPESASHARSDEGLESINGDQAIAESGHTEHDRPRVRDHQKPPTLHSLPAVQPVVDEDLAPSPDLPVVASRSWNREMIDEDFQLAAAAVDQPAVPADEAAPNQGPSQDVQHSPDRQRADRLLERARKLLESGYLDEALRLAQIAVNLERSQRAIYLDGEERPSDFVSEFQSASIADKDSIRRGASKSGANASAEATSIGSNPPVAEVVTPLDGSADQIDGDAPVADEQAEGTADATSLGTTGKRYNRSAGRRKLPDPGSRAVATIPPIANPPVETEEIPESPVADAEVPNRQSPGAGGEGGAVPVDVAAPAPVEIEVSDLPILDVSAPAVPRAVRRYWTWNKVSLTGMVSGLVMLVLLWIWRELERWHYRLTHPA